MDYQEGLGILISIVQNHDACNFDKVLDECSGQMFQKALRFVPADIQENIRVNETDKNANSIRESYIRLIIYFLNGIQISQRSNYDKLLSAKHIDTIKTAIEIVMSITVSCLLPGVAISVRHLCTQSVGSSFPNLSENQKYESLTSTANMLLDCFDDIAIQPTIVPQLGVLLAILIQLSAAPLMKARSEDRQDETNVSSVPKFKMTIDLYNKFKKDQGLFQSRLQSLMDKCPPTIITKELMRIHGNAHIPNWLRRQTQKHLISRIMRHNGVSSLVRSICPDTIDSGIHWEKLSLVAKLVASPQGQDHSEYYESICSQLLELLYSTAVDASEVANYCIAALYEQNPTVFFENILNPIIHPFITEHEETKISRLIVSEVEVTKCIEGLAKCFILDRVKFNRLPISVISQIAVPLFHLYMRAHTSAYVHKNTVQKLLLLLLSEASLRPKLFAAFFDQSSSETTKEFGNRLTFGFGSNGYFEVIGPYKHVEPEEIADCLLKLVESDPKLSCALFCYLLESISSLGKEPHVTRPDSQLADNQATVDINHVEDKLARVKLLSILAETSNVQDAQVKNPEHLLVFIKSLIKDRIQNDTSENPIADTDIDVLYISLMFLKVMLMNNRTQIKWNAFDEFELDLKEIASLNAQPELVTLANKVKNLIQTRGAHASPRYEDYSDEKQSTSEFDKAINDLAHPLLPIRAHGLIALTKLIERSDTEALDKKYVILRLFQENLYDEDSFIYLSAINGISTLATYFPEDVVEMLTYEFRNITHRSNESNISPDTRAKVGEILVKVTRALGDLAVVYKNILINAFLCGTRDIDPLVRASSLSCLGELCEVLSYRLGSLTIEILLCIGCIIKTDKAPECRRAGVLVATMLLRGLGKHALTVLGNDLLPLYRALRDLRNDDEDPVLRLHAQLALDEFNHIARDFLFAEPKLEWRISI